MYVSIQLIQFIVQWKLTEYYKETVPQVEKKKERANVEEGGGKRKKKSPQKESQLFSGSQIHMQR